MNTKYIMILTATFLGLIGLTCTFAPNEILLFFTGNSNIAAKLVLQIMGALFLAFAMLNWMNKGGIIGGIYNRPLTTANFLHFMIGSLALIKGLMNTTTLSIVVWVLAGIYLVFSIVFGVILSRHPIEHAQATTK